MSNVVQFRKPPPQIEQKPLLLRIDGGAPDEYGVYIQLKRRPRGFRRWLMRALLGWRVTEGPEHTETGKP